MLNCSASLAMSTTVLKALPGKLDIKRHSPSILYFSLSLMMSTSVLKALPGKLDIKIHSPSILYVSASLAMSTSILKALPSKLDSKRHSPSTLYLSHIYASKVHTDVSSTARGLNFGPSLHLHPYFVYASSECSEESVHCRLVRALAVH